MIFDTSNSDSYTQKDLLNEDGTASNVVISALIEVELEDLMNDTLATVESVAPLVDMTVDQATAHVERVFKLYSATAMYLLLDESDVDQSLNLIHDLSRVILREEAEDIGIDFDTVVSVIQRVVDSSTKLAAEFIQSENFREYRDALRVE